MSALSPNSDFREISKAMFFDLDHLDEPIKLVALSLFKPESSLEFEQTKVVNAILFSEVEAIKQHVSHAIQEESGWLPLLWRKLGFGDPQRLSKLHNYEQYLKSLDQYSKKERSLYFMLIEALSHPPLDVEITDSYMLHLKKMNLHEIMRMIKLDPLGALMILSKFDVPLDEALIEQTLSLMTDPLDVSDKKILMALINKVINDQLNPNVDRAVIDLKGLEHLMSLADFRSDLELSEAIRVPKYPYSQPHEHLSTLFNQFGICPLLLNGSATALAQSLLIKNRKERYEKLRQLLESGFDVNEADSTGSTIAHKLFEDWRTHGFGQDFTKEPHPEDFIRLLIKWGADFNLVNDLRKTPLHIFAGIRMVYLKHLYEERVLIKACYELLLEQCGVETINHQDHHQNTPFLLMLSGPFFHEAAPLFLAKGADPNQINDCRNNALHCLAMHCGSDYPDLGLKKVDYITEMVGKTTYKNRQLRNNDGNTPLMLAKGNHCESIVKALQDIRKRV